MSDSGVKERALTPVQKQQASAVEKYFEKWCGQLLEMKFEVGLHVSLLVCPTADFGPGPSHPQADTAASCDLFNPGARFAPHNHAQGA